MFLPFNFIRRRLGFVAIGVATLWLWCAPVAIAAPTDWPTGDRPEAQICTYDRRRFHRQTGIGKFYMGREIAKVIGHQDLFWLERPTREAEERPDVLLNLLKISQDDAIADLGAGTGFLTFRILDRLNEDGRVYAVDVEPESQDIIDFIADDRGETRVTTILSTPDDPKLPEGAIDLVFMLDAYHEFEYPCEMMQHVADSLVPGGRVVLVEYRRENPLIAIKTLHKMTERQAKKEMAAAGLRWVTTDETLPSQHVMVFARPTPGD
ncbi:MAG: class I SAM-dependent methyltransferase [Geitlerinemataceae cyanobacterium]